MLSIFSWMLDLQHFIACFLVVSVSFLRFFPYGLMISFSRMLVFISFWFLCIYCSFLGSGYHEIHLCCPLIMSTCFIKFSSVQSLSCVRLFVTPWIAACQASLSITNSRSSLKLMSIKLVMPSSHLILCYLLFLLPPVPPSIRVFSSESTLHMRWPKYWSFSFSIIPSKKIPGLISFRMDWLDLLAVQGTLKSLLQHHSSKARTSWCSSWF